METKNEPPAPRLAMARDPLSSDDILTGFYRPERAPGRDDEAAEPALRPAAAPARPRPTHYKVVCISLYNEDIERLDGLVAELKRRGHSKANKSQVIREALLQIDLDRVPRQH
jgi:hypothetical protein